jgi:hypothetical protein
MPASAAVQSAKVTFNPQNQNLESLNAIVAGILGKTGCRTCGRLVQLDFQFQVDPDPNLASSGVISVATA